MLNLIRELPKDRFNITVVSIFRDQFPDDIKGVKYRWILPFRIRGIVALQRIFSQSLLYRIVVGVDDYDIVVSYWEGVTMRVVGGKPKQNRARLVNWIHNEFKDLSALKRMFKSETEFHNTITAYDKTVFVADSAKKNLTTFLPELTTKSETVHNVIYPEKIIEEGKEEINPTLFHRDAINLISVGRLAPAKGFDRLIRLVSTAKKKNLNVNLYLLGVGELKDDLLQEAKNLGVEENVIFLGWQSNPHKYVSKADLFVCSSLHEGYSTAVSEALILGIPVISTLCSGMEELLGTNGEYGIIVPNNETCLTDTVINILSSKNSLNTLKQKAELRATMFCTKSLLQENITFLNSLTT